MDPFDIELLVGEKGSRFTVVALAAKRAKQIKAGSPPLVETTSRNPLSIALEEISAGKVRLAGLFDEAEAEAPPAPTSSEA